MCPLDPGHGSGAAVQSVKAIGPEPPDVEAGIRGERHQPMPSVRPVEGRDALRVAIFPSRNVVRCLQGHTRR